MECTSVLYSCKSVLWKVSGLHHRALEESSVMSMSMCCVFAATRRATNCSCSRSPCRSSSCSARPESLASSQSRVGIGSRLASPRVMRRLWRTRRRAAPRPDGTRCALHYSSRGVSSSSAPPLFTDLRALLFAQSISRMHCTVHVSLFYEATSTRTWRTLVRVHSIRIS